jgi:hypothetical protein
MSVPRLRSAETSTAELLAAPSKKNKVFFFGNYEGVRQVLDTTYVNYVPTSRYVPDNCTAPCVVNPASAAMLNLYPAPNGGLLNGNPDIGIYITLWARKHHLRISS